MEILEEIVDKTKNRITNQHIRESCGVVTSINGWIGEKKTMG